MTEVERAVRHVTDPMVVDDGAVTYTVEMLNGEAIVRFYDYSDRILAMSSHLEWREVPCTDGCGHIHRVILRPEAVA